jgi:hypothetical protein
MSDLKDHDCDQREAPRSRIRPGNRLGRDLKRRVSDLLAAVFALALTACVRAPDPVRPAEVHRLEVWVDAFSPPDGDGTKERPFKILRNIPAGALVHLRSGLYAGPFVLERGVTLSGVGEVVLTGEAGQAVVTATDATLEGLRIQGGAVGLVVDGHVVATRLGFSGQRERAAKVRSTLTLSEARFEGTIQGIDAVEVARGATLALSKATFTGGFARGIVSEGGRLVLREVSSAAPKSLLRAVDSEVDGEALQATGGSGPALALFGGNASLRDVQVSGHEYALLVGREAKVAVTKLRARSSQVACVAVTGATLELSDAVLVDCGPGGAASLLNAHSTLSRVEISAARELGIFVRQGDASLSQVTVSSVSGADGSLGDGLHVREAKVVSTGALAFSDLQGSAVFASAFADVQLEQVTIERARSAAFFVERKSGLRVGKALVRGGGGPALVVPDDARADFKELFVAGGTESPVFAECNAGAEVRVERLETTIQQLPARCLSVLSERSRGQRSP